MAASGPTTAASGGLFVTTLASSLAGVIVLVGALVRAKVAAVALGDSGVGIVAQLGQLSTWLTAVAGLGLGVGAVRVIAARAGRDDDVADRVAVLVLRASFAMAAALALAVAAFAAPLSRALFAGAAPPGFVLLAAASIPLSAAVEATAAILQGRSQQVALARVNTLNAILHTVAVVSLVIAFGVAGGAWAVLATSIISIGVHWRRSPELFRRALSPRWRPPARAVVRDLLAVGLAALVFAAVTTGGDVVLRTLIVHRLGVAANGLYQPVFMLSSQIAVLMLAPVWSYLYPRLTHLIASGSIEAARLELAAGIRLIASSAAVIAVVAIILRRGVTLLFAPEFAPSASLVPVQVAGDYLRAVSVGFGAILLPTGRTRTWLGITVAAVVVDLVAARILLWRVGLSGAAIAYLLAWSCAAIIAVVVVTLRGPRVWESSTAVAVVGGGALVAATIGVARVGSPVVDAAWGALALPLWVAVLWRWGGLRSLAADARAVFTRRRGSAPAL